MKFIDILFISLIVAIEPIHAARKSLNFLMVGDWGWNSENQSAVAYQMGVYGWRIDAQFVLSLGDNFYEDGIDNVTDPLWNKAYHDVYSASSLQIPWYAILGNRDYHVDPQAQIDRSFEEDESLWTMPSRYFVFNYTLPSGDILSVVNIDTQLLDTDHDDTGFVYENPKWRTVRKTQLDWIDSTLAEQSKVATWVVVTGHYPIYSVGLNGDNDVLLNMLAPILRRHNVHMYIAGHDHSNQYIAMDDGITYVVCGQGAGRGPFGSEGVKNMGISASTPFVKTYSSSSGFAYAEVNGETFNVTFVDTSGNVRYTGVMNNPHTAEYRASISSGSTHFRSSRRSSSSGGGGAIAAAVLVPGLCLAVVIVLYVFRETPPVDTFLAEISRIGKTMVNRAREIFHPLSEGEGKIRAELDVSTRSDVGFTSDMDRSGRRQNVPPRELKPQGKYGKPKNVFAAASTPVGAEGVNDPRVTVSHTQASQSKSSESVSTV
mmetsp:Transcript_3842/g.5979  ORF Transcript_3842/g.5979 Transcript_3842/m.5979 type:complete len:488 (+) Transcript_3842:165-1628(+)|eukprot:CAMPEP_0185026618 /NCGR_PEP_ID=MMETSP1103-20130426/10963_1 /TAXON_ID=36769 /ORGANISM="Paraphysomonas bandaiensis, Strain Caron Lab Isolate" /LENGTH=487 /DNA_ID=CAMNT_0027560261 /DNA_START=107 /DNA_END=1570 /DNA_ORIENTATION=+